MDRWAILRVALCAYALSCMAAPAVAASGHEDLVLDTNWRLQSAERIEATGDVLSTAGYASEGWYATSAPKTVLGALVDAGVYPDPYFGENLRSIPGYREGRWLAMKEDSPFYPAWWYCTEFTIPKAFEGKYVTLHLDGINYRANVWLNGKKIAGQAEVVGMFRRFAFDITGQARLGETNALAIEVTAPGHIPDEAYRSKQIEATTGWDDHNPQPPDLNMGIWRSVFVRASGPVRVSNSYVSTDLPLPELSPASLTVSTELANRSEAPVEGVLLGRIGSLSFSQRVALAAGEVRTVTFAPAEFGQLVVESPALWWPHPVGPQNLHSLDLAFEVEGALSDREHVRFGIREVHTEINDEGWRQYYVNGRKILVRGGAYMTSDMLLNFSKRRYDALVRYMRAANLNMLRSEGFSIRETDEFFDICDEYGVMVTQQIFGRSIPDEALAIACTKDTLLRIRNHPSLVHFLGHDETFPTKTLDQAYRDLIAQYTPERSYQPHSGAFDVHERFETGGTRTGTRELWTFATPAHYYVNKVDGAWGFAQSGGIGGIFTTLESMRKMLPEEALWPPFSEAWSFHTVLQSGRYFNALLQGIEARYGPSDNIEDFLRRAHAMNYESARGMFEAYGRNKYSASGITTWKYNAAWPAGPTWQYVDWYLQATPAYYGAKKACEGLHIQYAYDDGAVYVVNSFYEPRADLQYEAAVYRMPEGKVPMGEPVRRAAGAIAVGPDAVVKACDLEIPGDIGNPYFLVLRLLDAHGTAVSSNFYWLSTNPDRSKRMRDESEVNFVIDWASQADFTALNKLPKAALEAEAVFSQEAKQTDFPGYTAQRIDPETQVEVRLHNPSDQVAFFVQLALTRDKGGPEVTPAYWSDNCLGILPGETRVLSGVCATADLEDASPSVRITGWNTDALVCP